MTGATVSPNDAALLAWAMEYVAYRAFGIDINEDTSVKADAVSECREMLGDEPVELREAVAQCRGRIREFLAARGFVREVQNV